MSFVRGSNPIWLFDDLIGNILDDTYYISFLSNTFPYLPQIVTHDNQGLIPWAQPIEFLANGTLPPDIFGDPNLVYRLEVRQGPFQSDPLIYVINDFVFGNGSSINPSTDESQENQISNPQFAFVNFLDGPGNPATPNPQIILTTAGTYPIAPGWSVVLVGTGSCTITQVITTGSQNIPNSPVPPYYLEFLTSGWTSVILEQTLNGNGAIWYNNFVAANILVRSNDSIAHLISVSYVPNTPGAPVPIISAAQMSIGAFSVIQGVAPLFPPETPVSTNTTRNDAAFVNIQILLPSAGTVDISNIQLFGIENSNQATIPIAGVQPDETIERQLDHLAHYYIPRLAFSRIPSWLVGWDFPLNPAQFGTNITTQAIGANKSYYAWDQTIIFQSANSGLIISRGTQGGLNLIASVTTQAAVIQYMESPKAAELLLNNIAVNMVANCANTTTIVGTISLWYSKDISLPDITTGTANSLVLTLDANGKPATFNGNWIEVPLKDKQEATFKLSSTIKDYNFPFWSSPGETEADAANFFAIVIGFASIPANTIAPQIISVGLNSGDIATRPGSQTLDQVLRECQYYYQKSYDSNVLPGTVTSVGAKFALGLTFNDPGGAECILFPNQFELQYKQEIRDASPGIIIYAIDGTVNNIQCGLRDGSTVPTPSDAGANPRNVSIGHWGVVSSTSNATFNTNTSTGNNQVFNISTSIQCAQPEQYYHYTIDARLGVV